MNATTLFWAGFGLTAVAIVGFGIAICRAGGLADEQVQRVLRQERAARAGVHPRTGNVQPSPQQHPSSGDEPRASTFSPARGATSTRNGAA